LGEERTLLNALRNVCKWPRPAVLSGEIEVCKLPEHNALLVDGLRKAGLPE